MKERILSDVFMIEMQHSMLYSAFAQPAAARRGRRCHAEAALQHGHDSALRAGAALARKHPSASRLLHGCCAQQAWTDQLALKTTVQLTTLLTNQRCRRPPTKDRKKDYSPKAWIQEAGGY